MSYFAKILIVSANTERASELREMLARAGFAGRTAETAAQASRRIAERLPDVVLVDPATAGADDLAGQLRRQTTTAELPIVFYDTVPDSGLVQRALALAIDEVLERGVTDIELVARLQPLGRLATMHAELTQRAQTALQFGLPEPKPFRSEAGGRRLLVVGDQAEFDEIATAMAAGDQLALEPDPYRAEQRLGNEHFDAAILIARQSSQAALQLAAQIRRNPRLFNLPVLLLGTTEAVPDLAEAYRAGATIAHRWPTPVAQVRLAVELLVRRQRRQKALRDAMAAILTEGIAAPVAGAYSESFTRTHLARLIPPALVDQRPLSLLVIGLQNLGALQDEYGLEAGRLLRRQVADWIHALVRVEDLIGQLDNDVFGVILPNTAAADAEVVRQRLTAILHHTEFHLTEEVTHSIKLWTTCGRAEVQPGDTPDTLVRRAERDAA